MAIQHELGQKGEDLAVAYLLQHGYDILERNWRFQKAEIDIIAQKNDDLVIVEVKTRSSLAYGKPEEFINQKKKELLMKASNVYVMENDINRNVRFDIISIHKNKAKFDICHIEQAFFVF